MLNYIQIYKNIIDFARKMRFLKVTIDVLLYTYHTFNILYAFNIIINYL